MSKNSNKNRIIQNSTSFQFIIDIPKTIPFIYFRHGVFAKINSMFNRMRKSTFTYILPVLLLLSILLPACDGIGQSGKPGEMEDVLLLPQLNFQLDEFIGEKVWVCGIYGDSKFGCDGAAFLVLNFLMLTVSEELPEYSFARLDGDLPPPDMNSAYILAYGRVKDFSETYNLFTVNPTPLVTVEKYLIISPPTNEWSWSDSLFKPVDPDALLFLPSSEVYAQDNAEGTKAEYCDRALILSGGKDANSNRPWYKHDVIAKYKKLKALGFDDSQIDIIYSDGSDIAIDGRNVTTKEATKNNVQAVIDQYKKDMKPSCTLTIFVTDHGKGYNEAQGYDGARPAFPGEDEHTNGKTYPESTFRIDLQKYVYQSTGQFHAAGSV
ncbi:MAG: hypothetical protein SVO01_01165, partial [Thermotogota bacterium]|nr:hypothetical protein [Thermotogota bacterium]